MTYKFVAPIEVQGKINGRPAEVDGKPVMVKHYYITSGREPRTEEPHGDPYVEVWADGSISGVWPIKGITNRLWLYDDQWLGLIEAVKKAMEDKKEERKRKRELWFEENGDNREHFGKSVTFSINEAKQILSSAPMRIREVPERKEEKWYEPALEIEVDGKWYGLCRTDLMDDVATHYMGHTKEGVEAARKHYLSRIQYGARISVEGGYFAVIDATTDG
jgi:hypothetical protein